MPIPRYALIIGSMKSGTTTLFNYLVQHPAIAGVHPKEPGFFAFDSIFANGRDWYDALSGFDPERHMWALDGSTDYTKFPFCGDVPARMANFADAEYRLIYLMRHPLRRIESHARHVQRAGAELGRMPSDRPDHSLDAGISPVSLAASRYAEQLDQYRPFYDQGRILLLTLEELSADPEATVSRVMKFLGLDPLAALERPEDENRAADKRRRARWWDALRAIPGLPWLATHLIPETARRRLDRAAARKVKVAGRFRLTPAEEETLLADLRPDLIRLRDVYGIDVERIWNIPLDAPIPASTPVSVQ